MDDHTRDTVGVDIPKAHPDVHRRPTGESARFANGAAGFEELAAWIGDPAVLPVYEAAGQWHRGLEEHPAARQPLARVNPLRARRFAQAMGEEARTDAADARTLAAMGASAEVRLVEPRTAAQRAPGELVAARGALVGDRTAALNRQKHARHPPVVRQLKNHLAQIGRRIKALDGETGKAAADAELSRRNEVPTSIPGIGPAVAAVLLADMPEPGRVDGKAAGSLVGVVPWTRGSGRWRGRAFIRGGCSAWPPSRRRAATRTWPASTPNCASAATAEGRPDGGHAQARGAGQRPPEAGPDVDPGTRARLNANRVPEPGSGPDRGPTRSGGRQTRRQRAASSRTAKRPWHPARENRRKPPLDNMDTHFALDRVRRTNVLAVLCCPDTARQESAMASIRHNGNDDWGVRMGEDDAVRVEVRMCKDTANRLCRYETDRLRRLNPDNPDLEIEVGDAVMHILGICAASVRGV